jgi:drug/metabolite transporter (DMT)-like permease
MAMPLFGTAYKLAPANFVAPFEYTTMFWAVLFGVVVFADIPDLTTLFGGGIVVAAGLYMLSRDAAARPEP